MSTIRSRPSPLFLFSLPRAGSTLCQRILGAHSEIATVSEPNILLHFLYSLKECDVYSIYNHQRAVAGIREFCHALPNGMDDYLAEMRDLARRLYAKAAQSKVEYFLDKTPQYHFVAEDILHLFPEAKAIFLWRHPLSVVSSNLITFCDGQWTAYDDVHFFRGIANLTSAYQKYADRVCAVRYEDLVLNPVETWKRVFAYLELSFEPDVLSNFAEVRLNSRRDPNMDSPHYQVIRQEPIYKWKRVLANPLRKAWCRRYLKWIGRERLAVMGYDLEDLMDELDALPFSLRFIGMDIYQMPYSFARRVLELRIMKHKWQGLWSGHRIYAHL